MKIRFFDNLTLSFQVAVRSNGVSNFVSRIFLEPPGSRKPSYINHTEHSSQVFTEELGFAGNRSVGNYTACEHALTCNYS